MKVQRIEKERTDILRYLRQSFKSITTKYFFTLNKGSYCWNVKVRIIRDDSSVNHLDIHKYFMFRDICRDKSFRVSQWIITKEGNDFVMFFAVKNLAML